MNTCLRTYYVCLSIHVFLCFATYGCYHLCVFLFNIFSDEYTSMRAEMADEKNPGATVMHEDNDLVRKS